MTENNTSLEVLVEVNEIDSDCSVWEITLNRPQKLNSFTEPMHKLLRAALEQARDDERCRAILLTGSGKGFCAGQDLSARDPKKLAGPPDLGKALDNFCNPLVRLLRSLEIPVVCAVNGVAAGAGANVALACDIVLAAESARFIQSFAKVGLIPDAGGTWTLPALIGEARAKALAMTATPVGAQQAEQWGMIWQCIADDALMAEARELAQNLAQGPTFGLGMMKQAIQLAATQSMDEQLETEAEGQQRCGWSADYAEGVSAFLEKRTVRFSGREN